MSKFIEFFSDPIYLQIIKATIITFVSVFIIWASYRKLSRKKLFKLERPEGKKIGFWRMLVYWLKYIFIFPLLTFFMFLLLVVCLMTLSYNADIKNIMFLGVVLVSAVRIAAYVHESMAEDLAKMLPLGLVTAIVLSPSFMTMSLSSDDINILGENIIGFTKYLLFIIFLEMFLKLGDWAYVKFKDNKKKNSIKQEEKSELRGI